MNLPLDQWREALVARPEFPEFLANHLVHVAKDHQDGVFSAETDVVEKVGGREPQSLQQFVRANRTKFVAQTQQVE